MTNKSAGRKRKSGASIDVGKLLFSYVVPGALIVLMTTVIVYLALGAYKGVTASDFFTVANVEVEGNNRVAAEEVESVVRKYSAEGGTWNADLQKMREALLTRSEIRSVAVSRQLPDTIRVSIDERVPKAVVRLGEELFWADAEGHIVGLVRKDEERPGLVMAGWDSSGGETAVSANKERVELYLSVMADWAFFLERVRVLDATNLGEVKAVIEESGNLIEVNLGKVDYGKRLKTAIEVVAGKGGEISAVSMKGDQPVVTNKGRNTAQTKGEKNE